MSEKPILFSAPMVRAILDGTKTQTRRVIKPQPEFIESSGRWHWKKNNACTASREWFCYMDTLGLSPCGKPGDHLWVRETHAIYQTINHIKRPDGRAFSEVSDGLAAYRADGFTTIDDLREHIKLTSDLSLEAVEVQGDRWRPSIHMPRWASRILLRVTDIRVELVQDITPADAKMEGDKERSGFPEFYRRGAQCHVDWFADLWDSINAKRGFGWNSNPWVWAVTFERVKP